MKNFLQMSASCCDQLNGGVNKQTFFVTKFPLWKCLCVGAALKIMAGQQSLTIAIGFVTAEKLH